MTDTTLRKIQAVASIGSAVVTLHGITSSGWQRRHTIFAGLGMAVSVVLFLKPLLASSDASATPSAG